MKIALYSRAGNPSLHVLCTELESRAITYEVNPCSPEGFDMAISFGGDGTFLSSIRKMGDRLIPILGINSGRLGFLAGVAMNECGEALDELLRGGYTVDERSLLAVRGVALGTMPSEAANSEQGCDQSGPAEDPVTIKGIAVNEFTLQKTGTAMVHIEVEIDGERVAGYWADGVIVSTSTGSTAYSMSVGGAILSPGCRCFMISPIAPHNLNIRPLAVPDTSRLRVGVATRSGDATATIDNREFRVASGTAFELQRAPEMVRIIRPALSSFYKTLREKLLWGVDVRNVN